MRTSRRPFVAALEAHLVEHRLEHGGEPPRADVLGLLVDGHGRAGQLGDGLVGEGELDPVGGEQRPVLGGEGVLGLGEDAHEVGLGQGLELHADGEPPLQLGDEVAGLAHVEGARPR